MREITAEWVAKAEDDFTMAHLAMRREGEAPPLADAVCFHRQQCAEKYVKAFLQENRIRFRRTHDFLPLLELCLAIAPELEQLRHDLESLEDYAVAVRYLQRTATAQMAEDALAAAGRVRASVRAKLGLTDPPIAPPAASP